jgi:NAD(P)-dependent dehydrogenase (short-subunit alcohol dehydrogenase family)
MSIPREEWQRNMNINAAGLVDITRAFADVMTRQRSGSIINIGSIYGLVGYDAWLYEDMSFDGVAPDYYYTKGGMASITRVWAGYYGKYKIRVSCVHPGGLRSERTDEAFVRKYSKKTFLGRMAGDTDLMGCIVFLASDASAYVTGVNIAVDGGLTAK